MNYPRKITAVLLAAVLGLSCLSVSAAADAAPQTDAPSLMAADGDTYSSYLQLHTDAPRPQSTVAVALGSVQADTEASVSFVDGVKGRDGVLKWEGQTGVATFTVEVQEAGVYNLRMTYMPIVATNRGIQFALSVDGKVPFREANGFTFSACYRGEERKQDSRGNDLTPRQLKQELWVTESFSDPAGMYDEPLQFYFEQGVHTLTIDAEMGAFYIAAMELYNKEKLLTYEEKLKEWQAAGAKDAAAEPIVLQGEDAVYKSDSTLIPQADRHDSSTTPNSPSLTKLNIISSSKQGQWMTWELDVQEAGFYKLGLRFKQASLRGLFVTRRIYINGQVPFQEWDAVKFFYQNGWQYVELGDPYKIYLEEGPCEIKMEVVMGDFSEIFRDLSAAVEKMNTLYRKIVMITGVSPDAYRDYYLDEQIDGFSETVLQMSQQLRACGTRLETLSGISGSDATIVFETADQLQSFYEQPETVPTRLDSFASNVSGLSAWIFSKQEQPLTIDYLKLSPMDAQPDKAKKGFFSNLWFRVQTVLYSFITDYSSVGTMYDEGQALTVWMNGGSDQAGVAKTMIDDLFVSKYNIPVNLKLVQGTIIEATFAGQGPDIVLNTDSTTIINLAARGVLTPLSDFADYQEAVKDFYPSTMNPYTHEGECYALPITHVYNMMFYRTDVFEELELTPPTNWQEFVETVAVLQSNNMQAGIPDLFLTLLLQNGISVYNEDMSATNFEKPEAVEAFKTSMKFFTQSTLPDVFDFYTRFRTGEMPLGIQPYSMFNTLSAAAPEIRNMWEMVPIPGTVREDGTVNNTQSGSGTAVILFNHVENQEDAWTFLKWWAGAEAQQRYGADLEMIMGLAARYTPANPEAMKGLDWSNRVLDNLLAQWEVLEEVPTIPASYYLTRGLTNAFRNVLYNNENPREALFYQNRLINKEITRKRLELGIE